MTAKVELKLSSLKEQLIIPDYALVTRNGSNHVYKIENNIARLIDLSVSRTVGSQVLIESGLTAGDTIVVVGMKNLGIETRVMIENIQ